MLGKKQSLLFCATAVIFAYLYNVQFKKENSPMVEVSNGKLQGFVSKSRNGNSYNSYLHIPFAQPPVQELRFEPPQPPNPWNGIRDAKLYGSKCLQFDIMLRKTGGNEDCLFLNVFTNNVGKSNLASVMVYIHGGLFLSGAADVYSPKYFMDEPDLVVVTINYRVGSLGFLNTGDGIVRGNMGLKDQTAALKWVQQNIRQFGGNPNRVTIFGESAGAASAHYHMLSPLSKGLFHKAIGQSGTALNHWALYDKPREQAERFAGLHNCGRSTSQEMVDCLKRLDAFSLVDVHQEVMRPLRDWITIFNPTVELIDDENAFLTKEPLELLKVGKVNSVPWITGVNSHEGLVAAIANSTQIQQLRQFYGVGVGNKSPARLFSDKFTGYTNLFSDRMFNIPLHLSVKLQSKLAPTYLYYYSYPRDVSIAEFVMAARGVYPVALEVAYAYVSNWVKRNVFGMKLRTYDGPCHGDDLSIFFPVLWDMEISVESSEYEFSRDVVKLWVDFAKYDEKHLTFRNLNWHPIDPKEDTLKYFEINSSPRVIDEPFKDRVAYWNKLKIKVQ